MLRLHYVADNEPAYQGFALEWNLYAKIFKMLRSCEALVLFRNLAFLHETLV